MLDLSELARFAWSDLNPAYSVFNDPERIDNRGALSPFSLDMWAERTAIRLITVAATGVQTHLYHVDCPRVHEPDALKRKCGPPCRPCCPGMTPDWWMRIVFNAAVGSVKERIGELVQFILNQEGVYVAKSDGSNHTSWPMFVDLIKTAQRAIFQSMYRTAKHMGTPVDGNRDEMARAISLVTKAVCDAAEALGIADLAL